MTLASLAALAVLAAVACEILFPGRAVYHYGWFNVALAAIVVVGVAGARKPFRAARSTAARYGIAAIAAGAAIAGFAGVANGLLAPDNRTVVGAPGSSVRVDELAGKLVFPLSTGEHGSEDDVQLVRGDRATPIGTRPRNIGAFVLRQVPRNVVYVDAADERGNGLTITQPNGTTFLSPVLTMQQHQAIPGSNLDVPFDAFAVPALHRNVRALLFSGAQMAMLHPGVGTPGAAVLFDVHDEEDRELKNGLAFASDGASVRVGGLQLRIAVFSYPAIELMAVPSLVASGAGAVLVVAGFFLSRRVSEAPQ